jgi:hypothetical protein
MKRDSQEFFDWWYDKIAIFEKKYPWAKVTGWGQGVSVSFKDKDIGGSGRNIYFNSVHITDRFFLKMIDEDKTWWEYDNA